MIETRDLSKAFGPIVAVDRLSMTVNKGEVLGFLGPNGAGKSTTMKMVTGFLAPSSGSATVCGHSVASETIAVQRAIGYLPEGAPAYPDMTPEGFLKFAAGVRGLTGPEAKKRIRAAADLVHLEGVMRQPIETLSKGYKRRVGLAQAIIHQPDVIILDEPTVGLDPIQIREIRSLISRLGEEHSVILSSHILPEIQATCNRVMIINQGQVVYEASMEEAAKARFDSLVLELARAPEASALQALAGIEAVESLGEGRFRLRFDEAADPREAVAAAAAEQGWGLRELHAEQKSLEEVFVELTTGERPQEAA